MKLFQNFSIVQKFIKIFDLFDEIEITQKLDKIINKCKLNLNLKNYLSSSKNI